MLMMCMMLLKVRTGIEVVIKVVGWSESGGRKKLDAWWTDEIKDEV